MKVLFIGANGKVGRQFADIMKDHPTINERAMIRNPEQQAFFDERGIETVLLDLSKVSVDDLAAVAAGMDAVIFSAGAGGKGLDKIFTVDLDGAVKAMEAAEKAGVKRFVMVSTFRTGRQEMDKQNDLRYYTIGKHYADEWLKTRTDLDWTIVHPGILTDEAGTGQVKVGMGNEIAEISRQDVARVLVAVLEHDSTIGKEFEVLAGDVAVDEAVQSV
ncbi:SDR family oxidoreductase [Fundicoccus culcitae]|uniref:SDR family oxidoreductase n=1 Tax=Fundicoccus culcitae TaxID=2969821 RepID=A0ABY5P9N9_9LACT|nr:SDR family oxidoreductase [Fundicoccus culcitae]UUX35068.1 SDR family oxidoreductase [Fundicoccus culcitae]